MTKSLILSAAVALCLAGQVAPVQAAAPQTLVVAGGCFWCVESDFEKVKGVEEVVSGFAGGHVKNPTYRQVVRGGTGHRESAQITYDPDVISEKQLLHMFFRSIDPTDAGGQFCDRGLSYTTAIFASGKARQIAEQAKKDAQKALGQPIVTKILDAVPFYPAGKYHQDYYKSDDVILSRFGPITKAKAYHRYREACGRDARVRELWGYAAPFAGK